MGEEKVATRLTEKEEREMSKINKWNIFSHVITSHFRNELLMDRIIMHLNIIIKMSITRNTAKSDE